jgi:hypothetical protein
MAGSRHSRLLAQSGAAFTFTIAIIVAAAFDASAQSVRLDKMVVVGDSVLAGFASGGLIRKGRMGQRDSAPALIARQAGAKLTLPNMTPPGFPPPLVIVDKNRNGLLDPGEVRRRAKSIGFRSKPNDDVQNLAVPGERVSTVLDTLRVTDVIGDAIGGDVRGRDVMKAVIVGLPPDTDAQSQITRAQDQQPTLLLVWLGNNDILGSVTRANPSAGIATPTDFGNQYRAFLDALADTGAPAMVIANIPDVSRLPQLRRAAGEITQCHDDAGAIRPVANDDLLSIDLDRSLLPVPPCGRVLDSAEQAFVRGTVMAFNAEIDAAETDLEQRRGIPIARVDAFALFDQFADQGVDVRGNGSLVLTSKYLGGLFTLDGVHPTRTAHALIANAFIDAMNARFGTTLARTDVERIASTDYFVGNRFQPAGEPPFGLIGKDDDPVDDALSTIENRIDRVIDKLTHRFDELF